MSERNKNRKNKNGRSFPETVEQIELDKMREREATEQERLAEEKKQAEEEAAKGVRQKYIASKFLRFFLWFIAILITVCLAWAFSRAFCQEVKIADSSMEPTLSNGETYFINSLAYRVGEPKRGDIIVFRTESDNGSALHVKRVIGLPGETIQIVDGQILIDGETYTGDDFSSIIDAGLAENPITLGDNEYFVLGDNRNGSEDSRYASIGNVTSDQIVGTIWLCVKPASSFGIAPS
jgi:signal peptidase I